MSECKYSKCDYPASGKSQFCCASHRAQHSREVRLATRNITGAQHGVDMDTKSREWVKIEDDTRVRGSDIETTYPDGSVLTMTVAQPSPLEDVESGPDTADTSQCFKDFGIPLPGDPGYKGVCIEGAKASWSVAAGPAKYKMTRAEMLKRYAHA